MEEVQNPPSETPAAAEASSQAAGDTAAVADCADQLATLAAERDQLAAEKAELHDLLLRRQAEFDNFRKRMEREKMEFAEYSAMGAVQEILSTIDDLERALKIKTADEEYARGMEMIHQRLTEALKRLGLEPIEAAGKKFDPNFHHAVQKQQSDDHEDDTVLEEYQKGYNFKNRLLRPAMVKVSVKG